MTTFNNARRKTLKDTDKYKARLEEIKANGKPILFVHVEVKDKIDVALIRELRHEFDEYKRKIKSAGYKQIFSYSATPKFYSLFKGYEDIGSMTWDDKEYRVLKWELK
jgi:hypothetical protein